MKKRELLCTVGGNEIGAATTENYLISLRKLNRELPYDPAIPLLDILLKKAKTLTWKDV